jgi:hypothetical protein
MASCCFTTLCGFAVRPSNPRFRLLSKIEAALGRSEGTDSAAGSVERSTLQFYAITG